MRTNIAVSASMSATGAESVPRVRLGLGCVGIGSASGAGWRHDVRLVEEAVDRGVTLFDTADAYGGGMSERVIGRALRRRRAEVVVATKAGYRFRERSLTEQSVRRVVAPVLARRHRASGRSVAESSARPSAGGYVEQDFSAPYLRQAVEGSLRRLQTDYIDVLQLHGPDRIGPNLLDGLRDLIETGKVRRIGVGAENVAVAAAAVTTKGVEVVQLPFGVLDPEAANVVFPVAGSRVEIWARGVLGGGLLKAAASGSPELGADPKWTRISALTGLAKREGLAIDELAVGFVRAHLKISTLLLGMSTGEHLRRNIELMEMPSLDARLVAEMCSLIGGEDG
jgi:aryl-alcohol dehydrogenase-like predicted oxidoreductase